MTATAIIINNGELLVVKRKQEPFMGKWDFVGGFLNQGELPIEALRRELKEELNVKIKRAEFLDNFAGTYKYLGEVFPVVSATYIVEISGKIKLDDENSEYKYLNSKKIDIAFDSNKDILSRVAKMITSFEESKKLVQQLDSTAIVDEFNLYSAQMNGYVYKKYLKNKLVGMGWIFPRQTMLRKQAVVEDMIVDESLRGKGYGKEIVLALIDWARKNKIEVIELTSNPKRIAANELYKKVGFKLHPTNHYLLSV